VVSLEGLVITRRTPAAPAFTRRATSKPSIGLANPPSMTATEGFEATIPAIALSGSA
jgi:hypothetical protein